MYPTLFQLGAFRVATFGFMIALSFLAGVYWASKKAGEKGVPPDLIVNLAVWIGFSSFLGARVLYILLEWGYFKDHLLEIVIPPYSGIVYYGGFFAAFATVYFYLRRHRLPIWKVGDILAPALVLGQAVGRWGCLFNGCCYGRPLSENLPWGIVYPEGSEPFFNFGKLPLHPSPIYESLGCLAIFLILRARSRRQTFAGEIFWLYVLLYPVLRLILEFFRGDDRGVMFLNFSISQWFSLALLPLAVFMLVRGRRNKTLI